MNTFLMFGKFSIDAQAKISAKRTKNAAAVIRELGGEIKAAYVLVGEIDVVLIVELPGASEVMKASVELTRLLGISFTTSPAVKAEEFDILQGWDVSRLPSLQDTTSRKVSEGDTQFKLLSFDHIS